MAHVGIHELKEKIEKEFEITFPTTPELFRQARKTKLFAYHTDKDGSGTNADVEKLTELNELFRQAIENFNFLNGKTEDINSKTTIDGRSLLDLGKGLGPTVNGATCSHCNGNGYEVEHDYGYGHVTCPTCGGSGKKSVKCNKCNNGKFTLKSGHIVDCRVCHGTGKFHFKPKNLWDLMRNTCTDCWGSGEIYTQNRLLSTYYRICHNCRGKGEILIHNPVLQKGGMQILQKTKKREHKVNLGRLSKMMNKLR